MHVNGQIEHLGIVVAIDGQRIDVEVDAHGACSSCNVKGACQIGDPKQKIISIETLAAQYYELGESVTVSVERIMGMKAVAMAYIFPFFVMIGVLLIFTYAGFGEIVAGLSSLGSLVVYYGVLFLSRKKIEREIVFRIRKNS